MLNSFKTRMAVLAAALLLIFIVLASYGFLPVSMGNRIKPDKTFDISVNQGIGDEANSRYEIKITSELPYEASVSSVLVVVRAANLKADPAYPVKVEALPFPENGEKVDESYEVRLKPGQSRRFSVVFPKAVSKSSDLLDVEIQVKAAAIGGDNRPYVVYTVRRPKIMENTT